MPFIVLSNGKVLNQTASIMRYLCQKYEDLNSYYSDDLDERATIDELLEFYSTTFRPALLQGDRNMDNLAELEGFLSEAKFVAGSSPSIADFVLFCDAMNMHSVEQFPHVNSWMKTCRQFSGLKEVSRVRKHNPPRVNNPYMNVPEPRT